MPGTQRPGGGRSARGVQSSSNSKDNPPGHPSRRASRQAWTLRTLHPTREASPHLPEHAASLSEQKTISDFEPALIEKVARSFPAGSSAGPSGLRPSHILEALKRDSSGTLLEALAVFSSDFANGCLPAQAREWFCGARIIGIPKIPSGVRPIAIGETLRRLVAKCLVAESQGAVAELLLPLQMGVGVPSAGEILAHGVRAWAQSAGPDEVAVLVDFANAYNTLDRQRMLDAFAERAPHFLKYAWFCYGAPCPLIGRGFRLPCW